MKIQNDKLPFADVYHVGPHKTASTTMHVSLLPMLATLQQLKAVDGDVWGHHVLSIQKEEGKLLIYTNESLLGDIYSPTLEGLKAIKRVNPNAHILLVTRRKESWARSLYAQSVKGGETRTFRSYRRVLQEVRQLEIEEIVEESRRLFPGKVIVLSFETVIRDPAKALSDIAQVLGIPGPANFEGRLPKKKKSPGDLSVLAMRLRNSYPKFRTVTSLLHVLCRVIDICTRNCIRLYRL